MHLRQIEKFIPAVAAFVQASPFGIAPSGHDLWVGVFVLGAVLVAERAAPERVALGGDSIAFLHPL